jgi:hypothetical protein
MLLHYLFCYLPPFNEEPTVMSANIIRRDQDSITVSVTIPLQGPMLESEEIIREKLNEVGVISEQENLKRFDADGSPIRVGDVTLYSKGKTPQQYETPYGTVEVDRYTYQTSKGGSIYTPLEVNARTVLNATPLFAKTVSYKYASSSASSASDDIEQGNGRVISSRYCKNLGDAVGAIASSKEEEWEYELPEMKNEPTSIAIGVDGTCMLLSECGWRVAMAGTVSLYDEHGERLHTIYTGATPEYGKEKFHRRFRGELERVREQFPGLACIGIGDGAPDNWTFMNPLTDDQVVDFWHVSEYVGRAAQAMFPGKGRKDDREAWLEDRLHRLKHKQGAAARLHVELKEFFDTHEIRGEQKRENIKSAIRYLENQKTRMHYSKHVDKNHPIGSGVTEAACKTLIKHRFCKSGSRWKESGASSVMSIRSLKLTPNRWNAFWSKISQFGYTTH